MSWSHEKKILLEIKTQKFDLYIKNPKDTSIFDLPYDFKNNAK